MSHQDARCRKCGSTDVRRSSERTILDVVMRAIFKKRVYRCRSCRGRFFAAFDLLADDPVTSEQPPPQESSLDR